MTKTFEKKTYFFQETPSRKKEKKRKKIQGTFFLKSQHDNFQSLSAHHSWVTVSRPLSLPGLRYRVAVHSCQENKRSRVKIHPQRKKDPTSGQRHKSDLKENDLCEPVRKPREIETCDKSGGLWERFCRMGTRTSFLIFFTPRVN